MGGNEQCRSYSIAVDIGGTFTDVVLRHRDGRFWVDKTLTTSGDLKQGFFAAVDGVMKRAGCRPDMIDDIIVHATTIVTNAIIERKAPRCALLTTEGFRDVARQSATNAARISSTISSKCLKR